MMMMMNDDDDGDWCHTSILRNLYFKTEAHFFSSLLVSNHPRFGHWANEQVGTLSPGGRRAWRQKGIGVPHSGQRGHEGNRGGRRTMAVSLQWARAAVVSWESEWLKDEPDTFSYISHGPVMTASHGILFYWWRNQEATGPRSQSWDLAGQDSQARPPSHLQSSLSGPGWANRSGVGSGVQQVAWPSGWLESVSSSPPVSLGH